MFDAQALYNLALLFGMALFVMALAWVGSGVLLKTSDGLAALVELAWRRVGRYRLPGWMQERRGAAR